MPRLSRIDVEKREKFVMDYIKEHPDTPNYKISELVSKKVGGPTMNQKRISDIRAALESGGGWNPAGGESSSKAPKPTVAARKAPPPPRQSSSSAQGAIQGKSVFIEGDSAEIAFFKAQFEILDSKGMVNCSIEAEGDGYLVVRRR